MGGYRIGSILAPPSRCKFSPSSAADGSSHCAPSLYHVVFKPYQLHVHLVTPSFPRVPDSKRYDGRKSDKEEALQQMFEDGANVKRFPLVLLVAYRRRRKGSKGKGCSPVWGMNREG